MERNERKISAKRLERFESRKEEKRQSKKLSLNNEKIKRDIK